MIEVAKIMSVEKIHHKNILSIRSQEFRSLSMGIKCVTLQGRGAAVHSRRKRCKCDTLFKSCSKYYMTCRCSCRTNYGSDIWDKRDLIKYLEGSTLWEERSAAKCETLGGELHKVTGPWISLISWRPFYLLHDAEYSMLTSFLLWRIKCFKHYTSTHRLTMREYILRIFTVCIMYI